MRKNIGLPALTVLLAGLPLPACVHTPPIPAPVPVTAPAVPEPGIAVDAKTLGWVRAKQVVRLAERVTGRDLAAQAAASGVDLSSIDPERPFVVLFGAPEGEGVAGIPGMAWLPVPPGSPLTMMAGMMGEADSGPVEGGVAITLRGMAPTGADGRALLQRLITTPSSTDVELFVQIQALVDHWRSKLDEGMASFRQALEHPTTGMAPLSPAMLDWELNWYRKLIDGLGTVVIGFSAGEQDLSLSAVTRDRAATSQAWPTQAFSMPDLAQFIAPAPIRIEWRLAAHSSLMEMSRNLYGSVLDKSPALKARLMHDLDAWTDVPVQLAMGMTLDGTRFMTGSAVSLSTNAEAQFAALLDTAEVMRAPEMSALTTQGLGTFTIDVQPKVRELQGWPVAHFRYRVTLGPQAQGRPEAAILAKLGEPGIEMEVVRLGNYLAYTINQPAQELDALVAALFDGKGPHPALAARTREATGGDVYVDLEPAGLMNGLGALMPPEVGHAMPQLKAGLPPVTLFAYGTPQMGDYHMTLPRAIVEAFQEGLAKRTQVPIPSE